MIKQKKIVNFRPIFLVFLSVLFGIVSAHKLFSMDALYIAITFVAFAVLFGFCLFYKKILPAVLCVISFFVGIGGYFLSEHIFMGKNYEGKVDVVGRVSDNINENDYYYTLVLENCYVSNDKAGGICLSVKKDDGIKFSAGDVVAFNGYLTHSHLFLTGRFNYRVIRDNTPYESTVSSQDLSLIHGDLKTDEKIREKVKELLYGSMSAENAGVAFAMLTGDKTNVDSDTYKAYRGAGVIHLLTVSGMHIGFLAAAILFILKKLKVNKFVNIILLFGILIFYCYICGFTSSVLRASIMAIILLFGPALNREYDKLTSLAVAGIIIILINPLNALDIGFLMSFSCVASIFMLLSPLNKFFKKFIPKRFSSAISVTLAAEIGIFPFLISMGSEINLLSVFSNLIIIPIFACTFILLFVFIILSLIPKVLVILTLPDLILTGIFDVASFFNLTSLKFSIIPLNPAICAVFFFTIFILSGFLMTNKRVKTLLLSFCLAFMSVFFCTDNLIEKHNESSVTVLNSYSQPLVVLENQNHEVLVVGGNIYSNIETYFKDQNKDIDYMLVLDYDSLLSFNTVSFLRERHVKEIISAKKLGNYYEEKVYDPLIDFYAGGFCFNFKEANNKIIGAEIMFDNASIFVATNDKLSYNNLEILKRFANISHDVFVAGKKNLENINAVVSFGTYNSQNYSTSFEKMGNTRLDLKSMRLRSID